MQPDSPHIRNIHNRFYTLSHLQGGAREFISFEGQHGPGILLVPYTHTIVGTPLKEREDPCVHGALHLQILLLLSLPLVTSSVGNSMNFSDYLAHLDKAAEPGQSC